MLRLLTALLVCALSAGSALAHGDESHSHPPAQEHVHKAPHGGQLIEVQPYHLELVRKPGFTALYLLDAHLKPVSLKGVTGKMTVKVGKDLKNVSVVIEKDYLKGKIDLSKAKGFMVVAVLKIGGKSLQGTFKSF